MALLDTVKSNLGTCNKEDILPEGFQLVSDMASKLGVSEEEITCTCEKLTSEGLLEKTTIIKNNKVLVAYKERNIKQEETAKKNI